MKQPEDYGIVPRSKISGNSKLPCPQCQHTRRNKHDKPLSLKIESTGHWVAKCHHCGATFGSGTRDTHEQRTRPRNPSKTWVEEFKKYKW